jgi:hypothetical protein
MRVVTDFATRRDAVLPMGVLPAQCPPSLKFASTCTHWTIACALLPVPRSIRESRCLSLPACLVLCKFANPFAFTFLIDSFIQEGYPHIRHNPVPDSCFLNDVRKISCDNDDCTYEDIVLQRP